MWRRQLAEQLFPAIASLDDQRLLIVALPTPARAATCSRRMAAKPCSIRSSRAAVRIAWWARSLRGLPPRGGVGAGAVGSTEVAETMTLL